MVVDEAHRLKNKDSALTADLRTLSIEHCHLLSGTPLQNNTTELWALLHYLDPSLFASLDDFLAEFGELNDAEQIDKLNEKIRPYLLRRQKVMIPPPPALRSLALLSALSSLLSPLSSLLSALSPPLSSVISALFAALSSALSPPLSSPLSPLLCSPPQGDVEKSLAPLEETIIWVEMTRFQKKCYKVIDHAPPASLTSPLPSSHLSPHRTSHLSPHL